MINIINTIIVEVVVIIIVIIIITKNECDKEIVCQQSCRERTIFSAILIP